MKTVAALQMQVKAGEQTELTSTAQQSAGEEQGSPRVGAVSLIPGREVRMVVIVKTVKMN